MSAVKSFIKIWYVRACYLAFWLIFAPVFLDDMLWNRYINRYLTFMEECFIDVRLVVDNLCIL
ncbi:MAG TPA: hypothetical protein DIW64_18835 [Cellvibrio sp.]|nr:hypothetical protein [Cellvibrio sp.]